MRMGQMGMGGKWEGCPGPPQSREGALPTRGIGRGSQPVAEQGLWARGPGLGSATVDSEGEGSWVASQEGSLICLSGAIGMNNRGAMGGTSVPAGPPPATGPGPMIPDGAMGMVRSTELSSLVGCVWKSQEGRVLS